MAQRSKSGQKNVADVDRWPPLLVASLLQQLIDIHEQCGCTETYNKKIRTVEFWKELTDCMNVNIEENFPDTPRADPAFVYQMVSTLKYSHTKRPQKANVLKLCENLFGTKFSLPNKLPSPPLTIGQSSGSASVYQVTPEIGLGLMFPVPESDPRHPNQVLVSSLWNIMNSAGIEIKVQSYLMAHLTILEMSTVATTPADNVHDVAMHLYAKHMANTPADMVQDLNAKKSKKKQRQV